MSDAKQPSGADEPSVDSLWGEALVEQMTAESQPAAPVMPKEAPVAACSEDLKLILDIPVK
ncbi:MAG: flagellar motor switch protein FliN, partial [Mixta calida]|nr:flagellar motor switch protein FliN [Mixta calida]